MNTELQSEEEAQCLQLGQNFYDQAPFGEILQAAADNTGIAIEELRRSLTKLVRAASDKHLLLPIVPQEEFCRILKNPKQFNYYPVFKKPMGELLGKNRAESSQYQEALVQIGQALESYPFFLDYLATQFSTGTYKPDGVVKPTAGTDALPQKYTAWANEKAVNQQNVEQLQTIQLISQAPRR